MPVSSVIYPYHVQDFARVHDRCIWTRIGTGYGATIGTTCCILIVSRLCLSMFNAIALSHYRSASRLI
eukprot:8105714-Pyramimonas_sp.AAC.1